LLCHRKRAAAGGIERATYRPNAILKLVDPAGVGPVEVSTVGVRIVVDAAGSKLGVTYMTRRQADLLHTSETGTPASRRPTPSR